jgi:hypothetical protein
MKSHFFLLLAFSIPTSLVLAFIAKQGRKERIKYFLTLLGAFIVLSIIAGWLMYPFPF